VRGESESAVEALRKSGSLTTAQWKAVVNLTLCSGVETRIWPFLDATLVVIRDGSVVLRNDRLLRKPHRQAALRY
jgi:hypothetical protein